MAFDIVTFGSAVIDTFIDTEFNEKQQSFNYRAGSKILVHNLKNDIGEATDLADEMPEKVNELRKKLSDWRKNANVQEMKVNPDYDPKRADMRFSE